jgi:hypothetical protein
MSIFEGIDVVSQLVETPQPKSKQKLELRDSRMSKPTLVIIRSSTSASFFFATKTFVYVTKFPPTYLFSNNK